MDDVEFWAVLAVAVPVLFLLVAITWWKGRSIAPVALLSLAFWPGAMVLALRPKRRDAVEPRRPPLPPRPPTSTPG